MNKPNCIAITFFVILVLSVSNAFAQPERTMEPSFEIVLQTLEGSNGTPINSSLPDSLGAIAAKLRSNFANFNFKVVSTHLQRISNNGSLNFKTVLTGLNPDETMTVSASWVFDNLNLAADPGGHNAIAFRSFFFQAEFPYKTTVFNEKNGGMVPAIGSDQIVVRNQTLSIPENEPTLLGTLAVPKSDKSIFLVITVRRF